MYHSTLFADSASGGTLTGGGSITPDCFCPSSPGFYPPGWRPPGADYLVTAEPLVTARIYYTIFAGPFQGLFSKILFTMAPGPRGIISQDLFQGFCMRIIHPELLSTLPVRLLCALHRDCCRYRGKSWGRGRRLQWLWNLSQPTLVWYHSQVLLEMTGRGYSPNVQWFRPEYRGKNMEPMNTRLVRVENLAAYQRKSEFLGAYPDTIDGCQAFIARWISKHPNTAGAK